MKIYTPTPDRHTEGDSIVVESYEEDEDVIYVGAIRKIDNNTLQTDIPTDAFENKWDIVSSEGKQTNWTKRFENSNYQLYMKAEVNNSGNISIEGV